MPTCVQVLLAKASRHLAAKEVDAAAAVYKGFERRGARGLPAAAATNLSFLYLLEGDLTAAAQYTDLALKADRWGGGRQTLGLLSDCDVSCACRTAVSVFIS